MDSRLAGVSVLVAGAGLAGLAAARDLTAMGATVTMVDARDRTGGRVSTIRGVFASGQHAEAGGDLIDEAHQEIRHLVGHLGLTLTRVLRGGWGHVIPDATGRPRVAKGAPGTPGTDCHVVSPNSPTGIAWSKAGRTRPSRPTWRGNRQPGG